MGTSENDRLIVAGWTRRPDGSVHATVQDVDSLVQAVAVEDLFSRQFENVRIAAGASAIQNTMLDIGARQL